MRFFVVCGVLLLFLGSGAWAGDRYQRAQDGKTLVWNPNPKADDAASWSGQRDKEHYATGDGILTWYRVERTYALGARVPLEKYVPRVRYSGKMVRGKLDGPVVAVDANGKTFHASFANGSRTGQWAEGPAGNPAQHKEEAVARDVVGPETESPPSPELPPTQKAPARQAGAAGVQSQKHSGPSPEQAGIPTSNSESIREQSAQLPTTAVGTKESPPVTSPVPNQQGSPGREVVPTPVERTLTASAPAAASIRKPQPNVELAPQHAADSPATAQSPAASPAPSLISVDQPSAEPVAGAGADQKALERPVLKKRPQADDVLRSLALPPTQLGFGMSLLAGAASERLSPKEVIELANVEAHGHGNRLSDYKSPRVRYYPADEAWLVLYESKRTDGGSEAGKGFGVKVEDKTKKTSIVDGR
jgi:hypothetical protein